jgi:hypothetical protein
MIRRSTVGLDMLAGTLPVSLEVVVGGVGVDNPMGMTWQRLLRRLRLKQVQPVQL